MSAQLEHLDAEFNQMIRASYPNVTLPEQQYHDLRLAFYGGIRIALNSLLAEDMTVEQMHEVLVEFIQDVKDKHGIRP